MNKKILVSEFNSIGGSHYTIIPFEGKSEEADAFYNNFSTGHCVLEVTEEKAKEMFEIQGKHIEQQVLLSMEMQKIKSKVSKDV